MTDARTSSWIKTLLWRVACTLAIAVIGAALLALGTIARASSEAARTLSSASSWAAAGSGAAQEVAVDAGGASAGAIGSAGGDTGAAARGATAVTSWTASTPLSRISPEWLESTAAKTGIPVRALAAYASASLTLDTEQPGCGLGWNTLAAIGDSESGHGSHGGALLATTGYSTPQILGPRLPLADTDNGAWDGDTVNDRAVGPMQFIPSTWATWGADGNGDGTADPNQIDDAALAAGRYLCHSGSVTTAASWRAAVYSYNHLDSYVDRIAETANTYAASARQEDTK